ncbi:MAG: DUF2807 domain-containing protein [Bacteroidales bacterium]|nr:DUF2807 domain-containing protein [Bacteroidales bacterium]
MKALYIAAVALLCSSCFHVNTNYTSSKNAIKGEGEVISKTFDFADFDKIEINGHADVDFTQSSVYEVTVRTQESVLEWLDYKVDGTTLVIQTKNRRDVRATQYDLVIQAPELKKLEINGASDFNVKGLRMDGDLDVQVNGAGDLDFDQVACDNFYLQVNGAADANLKNIDVRKLLKVEVNGASDVDITGNVQDVSLEVNGAGDIDASGLKVAGEVKKHKAGLATIRI